METEPEYQERQGGLGRDKRWVKEETEEEWKYKNVWSRDGYCLRKTCFHVWWRLLVFVEEGEVDVD